MGQFTGQFFFEDEKCPKTFSSVWEQIGIEPRAWQEKALPVAMEAISSGVSGIVQAVMGAGKSMFIAAVVAEALGCGAKCVVVTTPRKSLVKQLSQTLAKHLPLGYVGRYFSQHKEPARPVIVACDASTDRLAESLARLGRSVDLWIADECHGSEADRIHAWAKAAQPTHRLGLTATPQRAKKTEGLTLWDREIFRYDASDALRDGVVVPFEIIHWRGDPTAEFDDAMISMIQEWSHVGPGIVDASDIEDAIAFSERLLEEGISCAEIHSKMSEGAIDQRLRDLKAGNLRCLVHVSLLKEGVDLPWLRWMGLRRQVESKVYFAQHVGRVLRADKGKQIAYILDPGDLFSRHKLNLEAILEPEPSGPPVDSGGGGGGERNPASPDVVSLSDDLSDLRRLCVRLSTRGLFSPPPSGGWRHEEATPKQIAAIEKFAANPRNRARLQSSEHVDLFRRLYAARKTFTRLQASDMLSVLFALEKMP
jgi:superfamily II DNA or RNA helicase